MLTVALMTTDSLPLVGGIARYLHDMIIATQDAIDWHMFTTVPATESTDATTPYRISRLPETRRLGERFGDGFPPLRKWNSLRWLGSCPRILGQQARDAVESCGAHYVAFGLWCTESHYWAAACRSSGIPYLVFTYGMELVSDENRHSRARVRELQEAACVVAISTATRDELVKLGVRADNIVMLYPGFSPETLPQVADGDRRRLLEDMGLARSSIVLCIGRLVPRKGFDLAVHAWARIASRHSRHVLVVAGDGPHRAGVMAAMTATGIGDRVRLLGGVNDREKAALLATCEFFVMPNRPLPGDMEGFGIVFLEAGWFGKPSIGGNNGGVRDVIVPGITGALVDTGGGEGPLSATMDFWLDNPEMVARLGSAARQRVIDTFSWSITRQPLLDWFSARPVVGSGSR